MTIHDDHGHRELRRLIEQLEQQGAAGKGLGDLSAFEALPFRLMLKVVCRTFFRKLKAKIFPNSQQVGP